MSRLLLVHPWQIVDRAPCKVLLIDPKHSDNKTRLCTILMPETETSDCLLVAIQDGYRLPKQEPMI